MVGIFYFGLSWVFFSETHYLPKEENKTQKKPPTNQTKPKTTQEGFSLSKHIILCD